MSYTANYNDKSKVIESLNVRYLGIILWVMRNHQRLLTYKSSVLASYIICEWRKKNWERRDYVKTSKNALKTTLTIYSGTEKSDMGVGRF